MRIYHYEGTAGSKDKNIKLRIKIQEGILQQTKFYLGKIAEEGFQSGDFIKNNLKQNADEIGEAIAVLGMHMALEKARIVIEHPADMHKKLLRNLSVFEKSVECLLGIQPGSFVTIKPETLKKFTALFNKIPESKR